MTLNITNAPFPHRLHEAVKSSGREGRAYFQAERIGWDIVAIDPENVLPNHNW